MDVPFRPIEIENDKNMIELLKEIKEKLYALQEYIVETHPEEGWKRI